MYVCMCIYIYIYLLARRDRVGERGQLVVRQVQIAQPISSIRILRLPFLFRYDIRIVVRQVQIAQPFIHIIGLLLLSYLPTQCVLFTCEVSLLYERSRLAQPLFFRCFCIRTICLPLLAKNAVLVCVYCR